MGERTAEEIVSQLSTCTPETIGDAVIALSNHDRITLNRTILPSHEELQASNDQLSDPSSPYYDPDLAN